MAAVGSEFVSASAESSRLALQGREEAGGSGSPPLLPTTTTVVKWECSCGKAGKIVLTAPDARSYPVALLWQEAIEQHGSNPPEALSIPVGLNGQVYFGQDGRNIVAQWDGELLLVMRHVR